MPRDPDRLARPAAAADCGLDRRPAAGTRRARTPATYDRILKHIAGHEITVHCTVTRQQVERAGYIEEFLEFWQSQPDAQ